MNRRSFLKRSVAAVGTALVGAEVAHHYVAAKFIGIDLANNHGWTRAIDIAVPKKALSFNFDDLDLAIISGFDAEGNYQEETVSARALCGGFESKKRFTGPITIIDTRAVLGDNCALSFGGSGP